ncbi:MAG TPA: sodium:solute symporter family protein, partial [Terriglobus sp.]
ALGTVVTVGWDSAWVHRVFPTVIAERDAILPALLVSLLALVVVSLITPAPTEEQLQPFSA